MNKIELTKMRDICLTFNRFLIEKELLRPEIHVAIEESNGMIKKAFEDGNPKPLKAMITDINDQVKRHMPINLALDFKKCLKEKANIEYDQIEDRIKKDFNKIIKRGKIMNHLEYELIENRVDEIYSDPSYENEVEELNHLLSAFDKSK
jgi:hypothetical protein